MKRTRLFLATLLALAGCSSSPAGSGKVTLLLKDAPGDFRSAVVTISEIELVGGGGNVVLMNTPVTTDLLTLARDVATIVDGATIPAGTYTQLRFVITGGYLDVGGTIYASAPTYEGLPQGATVGGELQMPSYAQSGLKVILPDGGLVIGETARTLVVDFDVSRSFGHGTGTDKWVMHPVIKATRLEQTGTIAVTLALAREMMLPEGYGLVDFFASLTPAGGGDTTVLPLTDLGDGTAGTSFPYLPAGDYVVNFVAPSAIASFTTDPPVPATATAVPAQTTTLNFVLTDYVEAPPM